VCGSISLTVPEGKRDPVLKSDFDDWCFDQLEEGVLAEWRGLDLMLHFAATNDAVLFKLKWL
jgi:hypothetical protein